MAVRLGDALVMIRGDRSELNKDFGDAEKQSKGFVSRIGGSIKRGLTAPLSGLAHGLVDVGKIASGMLLARGVEALTGAISDMVSEVPRVDAMANTFDKLVQSVGGDTAQAMDQLREATRGMVADADLLDAGNKFLAMGLADTTEGAAELAEVATQLGLAMGEDATGSMENFALMMANQSIPRLDSFGISSGKVRQRIEELMEADADLTREQAFNTAVMEEARITMEKVGEQGDNMAASQARMAAKLENVKLTIGRAVLPMWNRMMGALGDVAMRYVPLLMDAFENQVVPFFENNVVPAVEQVTAWLGEYLPIAIDALVAFFRDVLWPILEQQIAIWSEILPVAFEAAANFVTGVLVPALSQIAEVVVMVYQVVGGLVRAFLHFVQWGEAMGPEEFIPGFHDLPASVQQITRTLFEILWAVVGFVMDTLIPGIQKGIAWIQGLFASTSDTVSAKGSDILGKISAVFNTIMGVVQQVLAIVVPILAEIMREFLDKVMIIVSFVQENWPLIKETIETILKAIAIAIAAVLAAIYLMWVNYGDQIIDFVRTAWNIINVLIEQAMHLVLGVIKAIMLLITGDWEGAWQLVKDTAKNIWDGLLTFFKEAGPRLWQIIQNIVRQIPEIVKSIGGALLNAGRAIIDKLREGLEGKLAEVKAWFADKLNDIRNMLPFSEPKDFSSPLRGLSKAGEAIGANLLEGLQRSMQDVTGEFGRGLAETRAQTMNFYLNANYANGQSESSLRDDVRMLARLYGGR